MVKWDEEMKFKLLFTIIDHLSPGSLPWDKIASTMGPNFSQEAVRGQYKAIKKGFNSTSAASTQTASAKTPKAKATNNASKTKAKPTANKAQKRKAPAVASDDDEFTTADRKSSKKPKVEKDVTTAEVFKTEPKGEEDEGKVVDLEHDELYDNSSADNEAEDEDEGI